VRDGATDDRGRTDVTIDEAPDRKTRWGDRTARRRDILAAARAQMAERGYLGLNMRDIAAGAGVSPGTLYSYFATKEEIFATLYAEAVVAHNERITPLCEDATELESFLREIITAYLDVHGHYGRYFSLWTALVVESTDAGATPRTPDGDGGRLPDDLTAALRDATVRQGEIMAEALRRLVPGPRRAGEQRRRIAFVWSTMTGVADHLHSSRHLISKVGADELIAYAARTLAAGLLANAAADPLGTEGPVDPPA
jgi:AcrR family transcriptional regulator